MEPLVTLELFSSGVKLLKQTLGTVLIVDIILDLPDSRIKSAWGSV